MIFLTYPRVFNFLNGLMALVVVVVVGGGLLFYFVLLYWGVRMLLGEFYFLEFEISLWFNTVSFYKYYVKVLLKKNILFSAEYSEF